MLFFLKFQAHIIIYILHMHCTSKTARARYFDKGERKRRSCCTVKKSCCTMKKSFAEWRKVVRAQSCSYKGAARWVVPESKQLMDLNFAMQCCTVHCSVHRGNIAIKTCHLRKLSVVISEWNQPRLNTTVKMGAFEEVKDSLNHLSLKIYEHPKGFHNTSMPKLS